MQEWASFNRRLKAKGWAAQNPDVKKLQTARMHRRFQTHVCMKAQRLIYPTHAVTGLHLHMQNESNMVRAVTADGEQAEEDRGVPAVPVEWDGD